MEIDTVITLENNKNYLLLMEDSMQADNYFLAVLLDDNEEPTNVYTALKEIITPDGVYCEKVTDVLLLSQLLEDYKLQVEDDYDNDK